MTSPSEYQQALLDWALLYAEWDLPVFPTYGPFKKNICQCPKGRECKRMAKHPIPRIGQNGPWMAPNGLTDATCDEAKIRAWWSAWPRANIGIAVPRGLVVLDLDGIDGLSAIKAEGWDIPRTATASTARGWHHWFESGIEIRPGSDFMPHVDMRGPGGYVIAPPSLHATGVQYEWELSPMEVGFTPAPPWINTLVARAREQRYRAPVDGSQDGVIGEGGRNEALTRIAGAMRRWGCPERAIRSALEVTNAERCAPPLDDEEVDIIASSVARYAPEEFGHYEPTQVWSVE